VFLKIRYFLAILIFPLFLLAHTEVPGRSLYFCGEKQEFWQSIEIEGRSFLPADLLVSSFSGKKYFSVSKRKLSVRFLDEKQLRCAAQNAFIFLENEAYLLPYPVVMKDGIFLLPISFFTDVLPLKFPRHFVFDRFLRKLYFFEKPRSLMDISLSKTASKELFVVHIAEAMDVEMAEQGNEVRLIFSNEPFNPLLVRPESDLLETIDIASEGENVVFIFEKKDDQVMHRFFRDEQQQPCLEFSRYSVSQKPTQIHSFQTIVIDPGHGGKDPGAVGKHYNTYEKNVVLPIALEVQRICEEEYGLQALLTRSDDTFIPLKKRTDFANAEKADLFVSIHANSVASGNASGSEVYFLSPAKRPKPKWLKNWKMPL